MSGFVLVELKDEFDGVYTPDTKYGSKNSGVVVKAPEIQLTKGTIYKGMDTFPTQSTIYNNVYLVGKKVYFESFKDDSQVKEGDKTYAFIDIKDIRGYKSE